MTDSPYFKNPLDPNEQPVLEQLLIVRDKLMLLKSDKSQYVRAQDVVDLNDQLIKQVERLNDIRVDKRDEQNRLDHVLDDCFQLVSLFFLTIGRNNEAPAAYAIVSTVYRLLMHLKEAGFFSGKDLIGIEHHLGRIRDSVQQSKERHSPQVFLLLQTRIDNCYALLAELKNMLSGLSAELSDTYEKLVSILRSLSGLNTKPKFPLDEVRQFQKELRKIEADLSGNPIRVEGSEEQIEKDYEDRLNRIKESMHGRASTLPNISGQDVVMDLLTRCLIWSEICVRRQGKLDEKFTDTFETLMGIRNQLEKLSLTQAWSLRETDLYGFQRRLDRIDEARVDGHFLDSEGNPSDIYEERTLLYLLRKSYSIIFIMIVNSEPVSEALLPVYNQLMTLKRCLLEVKKSGGVSSPRELYPYSMKLHSIDNMREDGKFVINGEIPEGQGSVTALLSECFEMAYDLRNDAEEDDENSEAENENPPPAVAQEGSVNIAAA